MKYTAIFSSLLLLATASPVRQRQTKQANISNFSASTSTAGNGASIAFDVEIPNQVSTRCSYVDETSGSTLPTVDQTPCDNDSVKWQFRQDPSRPGADGQYRIVVIHTLASGAAEAGFHEWAATDFPLEERTGSSDETVYTGAADFAVGLS
ncbi:hypothetical protein F5Y14DRAFT_423295 [Nemania sp. NC0429]|nr:hypothetical protein F5Y14DRAFT_423295 [Nemania sp. NC0429]